MSLFPCVNQIFLVVVVLSGIMHLRIQDKVYILLFKYASNGISSTFNSLGISLIKKPK